MCQFIKYCNYYQYPNMRRPPKLHPLLLLTISFLLVYTHCQPSALTSTVRQSTVYVVKFFKATPA